MRWFTRILIILLTLLFLAWVICSTFTKASEPLKVGFSTKTFYDHTRDRSVDVYIWYPVNQKLTPKKAPGVWKRAPFVADGPIEKNEGHPRPLVLVSHGFSGSSGDHSWLAEALVDQGYIVAAVKHKDLDNSGSIQPRLWDRPLDVSFALTEILRSKIGESIDLNRIGFCGYSMGGFTGIWLAGGVANLFDEGHYIPTTEFVPSMERYSYLSEVPWGTEFESIRTSFRDPRIRAEILIAPSWGWVFDEKGLKKINIPVQIIAPEDDERVVTQTNAGRYSRLIPDARLVLFRGGVGHYTFLNEIYPDKIQEFDPDGSRSHLYTDRPGIDRARVHQKTSKLVLEFFNAHLRK